MKRHSAPKVTRNVKPAFRYNFTSVKLVNILNQGIPVLKKMWSNRTSYSLLRREEMGADTV